MKSVMAKVSPAEYVRQIRLEAIRKVAWPTPREAGITTVTVFIMVVFVASFFFLIDQVFSEAIQY